MSLITRCPACGTMFKVVTDQLKVSQGWVRCGHCAEVFDASLHLQPRDTTGLEPSALAPERMPEIQPPPQQPAEDPVAPASVPPQAAWAPARSFADNLTPAWSRPDEMMQEAQDSAADFDPIRWKLAQQERQPQEGEAPPRRPELVRTATVDEATASDFEPSGVVDSTVAHDVAEVSFVRDARRKAFWKKPLARGSLGILSLLLLALLALQWVMQQKDSLAALEPRFLPVLQALCGPLRCEIRPPRHIESLVIDSSNFNKIGPDGYRLSFALKNTSAMALEMPSLEVTLTDTRDQAVLRRVLAPAQYGASTATLAAQSELAGVVLMTVSGDEGRAASPSPSSSAPAAPWRVAGYRVLAFYP
ncbi:DUF3426 domain-containing protein [Polaromonas jejuensis]|uniref:DUF3426 domain-containing protein n=1 Tax=Polaromonas jejuensis TaxID=457502 RepID=A0ABW0Q6M6_9BURK|nr:DUF3426 domain-containing protein [Polaromonas jejuensis]